MAALSAALACGVLAREASAELRIGDRTMVVFASAEEGAKQLTERDDFVARMSPFDRAVRMQSEGEATEENYLKFVGQSVLAWSNDEKQRLEAAVARVGGKLAEFDLPFPATIVLIKTSGAEEGGAFYTRGSAIVFPQAELAAGKTPSDQVICHELFHVLSRANPELREAAYNAIGYESCDEVEFPAELRARKITNPDAPRNNHCIRVHVGEQPHWVIPVLYSRTETYNAQLGGRLFSYLQFKLLLVDRDEATGAVTPLNDDQGPRLAAPADARGFYDQVGLNTPYVIHPEETLADNFAMLVLGETEVQSPQVLVKLKDVLGKFRRAAGEGPAAAH
jgi:hypothetical protein